MLCIGARDKKKMKRNKVIVAVFWPGRVKENCGLREETEDMMSKCQMGGELCLSKKAEKMGAGDSSVC